MPLKAPGGGEEEGFKERFGVLRNKSAIQEIFSISRKIELQLGQPEHAVEGAKGGG